MKSLIEAAKERHPEKIVISSIPPRLDSAEAQSNIDAANACTDSITAESADVDFSNNGPAFTLRTIQPGIVDTVKPSDVAPVVYWATRKGSAVVARFSATKNVPPLTLRLHAMNSVHRTRAVTMDCTCAILTVILLLAY
jgi:hypothetical protein